MSNWQWRFITANKKLKEIELLVTEIETQMGMVHKKLEDFNDESMGSILNAVIANLKKIKKIISPR